MAIARLHDPSRPHPIEAATALVTIAELVLREGDQIKRKEKMERNREQMSKWREEQRAKGT